jgi:ATP-dependent Lon protease
MARKINDIKTKNNNKKKELQTQRKNNSSSSSDSDSDSDSDYVDEDESEEEDKHTKVANTVKYTKFLSKMFPSKYLDKKLKDKKKMQEIEEEESEEDDDYDEDESEEEEEDDREKIRQPNVNIYLSVEGNDEWEDDEDEWEDDEDEEEESSDEDEDVSVSSDDDDEPKRRSSRKKGNGKGETKEKGIQLEITEKSTEESKAENDKLLQSLLEIQQTSKNNKIINECVEACKKKIKETTKKQEQKTQKQKQKNQRIFTKMLRNKKLLNEPLFFKKMSLEEQKVLIKELREINKIISVEKPYRLSLLESKIPILYKSIAMKKINLLKSMDQHCSEYYKIKHWVDSFMRIPFGKYENLSVSIKDGVEQSHAFMENAKNILDTAVYGLNDAKMQIMQMLGQFITNPNSMGCAIAIKGPPGTGKTSLVKEGISKILNRPFAFIALGGATDSSFLEGHSYTYEGSIWGKIVQILMDSKCMNPVIYFDELDKISETPKGDEIVGILTHLTDTSQNSQFHDKYFSEIDFDLSKCLFIFSYNDETKISPILRDRMYRIQTKGYDKKQKTIIANQYLLPKIREQVKFETGDIIISDDVLHYIIENYCDKEDGVRNQKRCLEIIHTKLNLYRLMREGSNLFEQDMSMKVTFPFQVTKQIVDKLIKGKDETSHLRSMYV